MNFSLTILKLLAQYDQNWTEERQLYYANLLQRNYQRFTQLSSAQLGLNCVLSSDSIVEAVPPNGDTIFCFPMVPALQAVFKFIDENYHRAISLVDVAQAVGYSPAYLTKIVGAKTGFTVNAWIVKRRLFEAQKLLKQTDRTIEEIAWEVGYSNVNHFFRQFRRLHGVTPSQWRNGAESFAKGGSIAGEK
ncbi:helix-turn-helix domain-containing protein [Leptolyngbya sp. 7M]|uniref:helix-turn-helix domain-containing protein n=1 Tax=Leptolyngbya sp. 7M TaxID=2812896 RepID=UPI001CED5BA9|nr:AraC family transcriptional regulator [Leptolyngbya sp. 7M]